jgi:hypothetical protein
MDGVGLEAPGKARPHGRICITNRLRRVPVSQIHTVQPLPLDASRSRARTGLLLRVSCTRSITTATLNRAAARQQEARQNSPGACGTIASTLNFGTAGTLPAVTDDGAKWAWGAKKVEPAGRVDA